MCNVASCWIYIGILLGAHPILHISRIRVNAHSAVKFVETILGFCFKLDSLHTHTSLMQYYFKIQCYRGNDLLEDCNDKRCSHAAPPEVSSSEISNLMNICALSKK
jgi:hypothetical protein